ncbi:hypothetical protein CFC21_002640 [Triticum aestivum]|uniref:At4g15545-like C-terminal domain-containing protein n=3 Tax=Triticum TaxID=4564 RepID=A0A9R0UY70_TRITD|nr:uncharacterized protein At4g15545-like [Triticum dicoccoides]XP_044335202.1 uncharacterized protein At4g15545-like [Triticum aestivum]KAF6984672.1 hypothetical protein CFC21_002640 [Triticum aestivum]VAH07298.1 unnamed protein product [Triticum turgidum subsp. durum]
MSDEGEDAPVAAVAAGFGLPEELAAVLPADPFEQLDVARKITSIALASRVGRLEAEAAGLRAQLARRDDAAEDLRERVEQLESALALATDRLSRAEDDKETLLKEKATLSNTVNKLNRDVAKLEVFKKTLMQSLQEDDDKPNIPKAKLTETSNFSPAPSVGDDDSAFTTSKSSQLFETASSASEESSHAEPDEPRPPRSHVYMPSYNSTPKLTPPGSPPRGYAPLSPPRRHSISIASMNRLDDRSSVFSSSHSAMTSPFDTPSPTGRTRVDGKEFFRQVRNRLSYEQFSAFLANVKELNAHKQTREDTLRKADAIFGPENSDLYTIFESLITRTHH